MKHITWREMLKSMYNGEAFDLTVCTLDRSRKTGGQRLRLKGVRLHFSGMEKTPAPLPVAPMHHLPTGNSRSPRHRLNGTLNLQLPNGELRKIHLPLIEKFNTHIVYP